VCLLLKKLLVISKNNIHILLCVVLSLNCISLSAQSKEEQSIKSVIHLFFKGLQNGDTINLKQVLYKDFVLQSVNKNKEGVSILHKTNSKAFYKAVGAKNPNDLWREDILSYKFSIDGAIANVWMPYKFYLNNKLSHCGVNSFQLFKNKNAWQIIYIIYTQKKKIVKTNN